MRAAPASPHIFTVRRSSAAAKQLERNSAWMYVLSDTPGGGTMVVLVRLLAAEHITRVARTRVMTVSGREETLPTGDRSEEPTARTRSIRHDTKPTVDVASPMKDDRSIAGCSEAGGTRESRMTTVSFSRASVYSTTASP